MSAADLLPFTAHRLRLPDGRLTLDAGDDPFGSLRTQALGVALGGRFAGRRILDLGALEGGYTVAFALMGAESAVGVEARELNVRRAEYLRESLGVANARMVLGNVTALDVAAMGTFDAVFASGILYHLPDPLAFLETVHALTTDVALIDTHVALEDVPNHGCGPELRARTSGGRSYFGREFREYPDDLGAEQVEALLWAAHGNPTSFWLTERSLLQALADVGFGYVHKVITPAGYGCDQGCPGDCRIMLVAKRDASLTSST